MAEIFPPVMVKVFPEPWSKQTSLYPISEMRFGTYRLTIGKDSDIVSIEYVVQHRFYRCSIQLFLLRLRSEDKVIFECPSISEDDLVGLRMNGNARFLLVVLLPL